MAQPVRQHRPLAAISALLNTDGKSHPVENSIAVVTLVLGLIAFITAQFHHLHLISSWVGIIGILTGARAQFISATTGERFVSIIGLGAAGIGFFLGMAHGGLFGGVLG